MADQQSLGAIDDPSKGMLEDQVKKGKARKFVLITKGASIRTLIVFKKGPYSAKINQAKKDGFRGEATCGVVTGKGSNVTFQLPGTAEVSEAMKAEGYVYEGEPCKIAKLRSFFQEEAGLKLKPEFAIVRSMGEVAMVHEDEDEDEEREQQELVRQPSEEGPSLQDAAAALKQQLLQSLPKLTLAVSRALKDPDVPEAVKRQLRESVGQLKSEINNNQLDKAKQLVGQIVALVKQQASAVPGQEPAGDGQSDWRPSRDAWQDAMDEVGGQLQRMAAALQQLTARDGLPPEMVGDLHAIAEFGLPALTGNLKTPIMAALLDLDQAAGDRRSKAAQVALSRLENFLVHLNTDSAIEAVEENPFGIAVSMRARLEPASQSLADALRRIALPSPGVEP